MRDYTPAHGIRAELIDWKVREQILDRRARYVRRLVELTGMSPGEAQAVFTRLPLVRRERRGKLWRAAFFLLAAALTLVASPGTLSAQSTSIGLWGGMLTPLEKNPDFGSIGESIERDNSFMGGARFTYWGENVLGFEAVAGYSPANVTIAGAVVNESRSTNEFVLGAKLMIGVTPTTSAVGVHLGVGPALIRQGQDVTNEDESTTYFGGVVGAGVRIPISTGFALRLDAEDYMYDGDFGGEKAFTNDLVLTAGLHLILGGK